MKRVRRLPAIQNPGERSFFARGIIRDLTRALEVATVKVERFEATGDAEVAVSAMDHLEREMKLAAETSSFVKRMVGLTAAEERSRALKKAYAARVERQWTEWETEVHGPSDADRENTFVEPVPGDSVAVFWRGKRIGYVDIRQLYDDRGERIPGEVGYWVRDPFHVSMKRSLYESCGEAVDRLLEEMRDRVLDATAGKPIPIAAAAPASGEATEAVSAIAEGDRVERIAAHVGNVVRRLEGSTELANKLIAAFVRLRNPGPIMAAVDQLRQHALDAADQAEDIARIIEATDGAEWKRPPPQAGSAVPEEKGEPADSFAKAFRSVRGTVDPDLDLGS